MDFEYSPKVEALRARVRDFMDRYVIPNNTRWRREVAAGMNPPPVVEELKAIAKSEGLWNLFLPGLNADEPGTRLTNLEYAPARRDHGPAAMGVGGVQLLRAGHRQHGAPAPVRHSRAARALAEPAARRRDPLVLRHDRAGLVVVRRDQHLDPHRTRGRQLGHQRAQVVHHRRAARRAARSRSSWASPAPTPSRIAARAWCSSRWTRPASRSCATSA